MPDVRKTSGSGAAPGVIYDISAARARAQAASMPAPADSVDITGRSRELARAVAIVQEAPELREEKIRELREQILSGTYRPDPRAIARSIINHGL